MKDNLVHVCFIIDRSGSMVGSESDIIGGFKKTIEEQKKLSTGGCIVSLYQFDSKVVKYYIGKDVNDIPEFAYVLGGCTALYDAVGTAVDEIGRWLNNMPESERPGTNLIVIMTDGYENSSHEYSGSKIKKMIKHQEDKYSWRFLYLGADLNTTKDADTIGTKYRGFSSKKNLGNSYDAINQTLCVTRSAKSVAEAVSLMDASLTANTSYLNAEYAKETGISLS